MSRVRVFSTVHPTDATVPEPMGVTEQALNPIAEGDLIKTPVMHLLLYLEERQSTGTLVIASPTNQKSVIRLLEGRPVAGRFPHRARNLEDGLLPLCGYTGGAYGFFRADLLSSGPGVHEGVVDVFTLAARSLAKYARDDVVDGLLARYGNHPMRLQPGRPIDRLRLSGREKGLLDLLRASPDTVANLTKFSPLDERMSRRVLYLLIVTKMVAPYRVRPSMESNQSDVRLKATVSEAPARSPERTTPSAPAQARSNRPVGRPVSALQSLASLRPRQSLRPGAPISPSASGRPVNITLESHVDESDPDVRYRRAQTRLKAGHVDDAVSILLELVEEFPDRARNHGMLAVALWEQYRAAGADEEVPSEVLEAIKKAHEIEPEEARAYYAKGLVFKHLGKGRNALACFKRAIAADPHMLDAKREARLLRMRSDSIG